MRKLLLLMFPLLALFFNAAAQKILGATKDENGRGIESATAVLLLAKDSSVVKMMITAEDGGFSFQPGPGSYFLTISHVGYAAAYTKIFEWTGLENVNLGVISLRKITADLKEVTVSSKKPLVTIKADKMILNVEGTINSTGSTALELLRKAPGVTADNNNNLSLAGKSGVRIYVDGKPTPLSGADLANYLKSISSASIESIEIITSPSARYDAAGNAGIINIRLKKNRSFGTNGSINGGYNRGVNSTYNAGLAFNHRNRGINVFGNYNYSDMKETMRFVAYRTVLDTLFNNTTSMTSQTKSHVFKTGADFFINAKNTLGLLVSGNLSDIHFKSDSRTPISYKPTGVVSRILVANNRSQISQDNADFNLNYRWADTSGRELGFDADYGMFRNGSNQLQPNYYYDVSGTLPLNHYIYRFISPTDIDIYTVKADYEQGLGKGKLGLGGKVSIINTGNNFQRYDVQELNPEQKELDLPRSNQFNYKEKINALYFTYSKGWKGVTVQAGLRVENTVTRGNSYGLNGDGSVNKTAGQGFKRTYTDFFPSASLSFTKSEVNQWSLSYARRIDRPAYQDLNPFEFKLDEYTFFKGNTALRPQYTDVLTVSNTYKSSLNTSLSYSHVKDLSAVLLDTTEKSKSFIMRKNLATQNITALSVSYPFTYRNYSALGSFTGNYSHYKADFGGGNRAVDLGMFTCNIYMQHSLQFGKNKAYTAEVSGWYNAPSVFEGFSIMKSMWSLDAGMQKLILKGKGSVKLSMADIFFTMKFRVETNFTGQTTTTAGDFASRQLKVSFTWKFGSASVAAARIHNDAAEEEKKRTKSSKGPGGN